ncbi:MAG: polysaccharide pyruvyl transferase family protein [Duncaniella sp.]|nr:polysaccharide pyruvyl transferase family protein [Duncaniella sp.]
MKRKVGIVTWMGYHNFGTSLQAFALAQVVGKLGYSPVMVDDAPLIRKYYASVYPVNPLKKGLSLLLKPILATRADRIYGKFRDDSTRMFDTFRADRFDIVPDTDGLDICIAGSDQIWSTGFPPVDWYLRHYFLADFSGVKIAYAPSLGMPEEKETEYAAHVGDWLRSFKVLSAREPEGARILSDISGADVPVLLDPTLLLNREEWIRALGLKSTGAAPYCLLYLLTYDRRIVDEARAYALRKGQRLVAIANHPELIADGIEPLSAGPQEFLEALFNSSSFVTDSFHGVIFASVFDKPFAVYRRFADRENFHQNNRVAGFLNITGSDKELLQPGATLDDRTVTTAGDLLHTPLAAKIAKSLEYLSNNLKQQP